MHANYRFKFYSDVHEFKTIVFQELRNDINEYFPPLCSLTRSQVFSKKKYFFSPCSLPCSCHGFVGCRTLKTGPRVEIYENAGFSFSCHRHVDGRKRIFEYKMSYILQRTLYVREAIVFGYNPFRVFVFMGKNDLTRLCVHQCVLFLKKNRKKKSVHFQKYEWMRP